MYARTASPNRCYGSGFAVIEHSHSLRIAGDASKRSRKHETFQAVKPPRPSLSYAGGSKLPGSRDDALTDPRKFIGASVVLQWLQDMRKSPMGGSDRCVGGERQSRIRPTVAIVFGQ
jgi:hypothetical protein